MSDVGCQMRVAGCQLWVVGCGNRFGFRLRLRLGFGLGLGLGFSLGFWSLAVGSFCWSTPSGSHVYRKPLQTPIRPHRGRTYLQYPPTSVFGFWAGKYRPEFPG